MSVAAAFDLSYADLSPHLQQPAEPGPIPRVLTHGRKSLDSPGPSASRARKKESLR
jgi:hypothetical protein